MHIQRLLHLLFALYLFNLDVTLWIFMLSAKDQSSSYFSSEYLNEENKYWFQILPFLKLWFLWGCIWIFLTVELINHLLVRSSWAPSFSPHWIYWFFSLIDTHFLNLSFFFLSSSFVYFISFSLKLWYVVSLTTKCSTHAGFLLTCVFAGSSRLLEDDSESRTVLVTNVNSKKLSSSLNYFESS